MQFCLSETRQSQSESRDELSAVLQVEILVGAVSIASDGRCTGQQEVSIREVTAEDFHERDGASASNKHGVSAIKHFSRRLVDSLFDFFREVGCTEAITLLDVEHLDLGVVSHLRRGIEECFSQLCLQIVAFLSRASAHGNFVRDLFVDHITCCFKIGGQATDSNHSQGRFPPLGEIHLEFLFRVWCVCILVSEVANSFKRCI